MPIRGLAMIVMLSLAPLAPTLAQAVDDSEMWTPETVPPSPEEAAPPAYAPPPKDAICGKLDGVLKKRLAKAERRKAMQTRKSLRCPTAEAGDSRKPTKRKRRSME